MRILNKLLFQNIRYSGISAFTRNTLQKRKVTILMFHQPNPVFFEKAILELGKRYNFISFDDFLNFQGGKTEDLPTKSMIITLDDGWKSNFDLLPVIKKLRTPVAIFLMSGLIDTMFLPWFSFVDNRRKKESLKKVSDSGRMAELKHKGFEETREFSERVILNKDEIREMQASGLVTFGSHTLFHPILPKCNDAKASREINLSKENIEAITGIECNLFSFPNGEYSERDIRLCQKAGYKAAVTLDVGFNKSGCDLYRLKRISVPDQGSISELLVKSSGLWAFVKTFLGRQKRTRRHSGL
ncbi:polysaccharide deacetylase family protein [Marinilabilia rubra]|uniref:Polysaccharide deacetylase n=1 Tax=Marinilabilia rubra TaxID=2162893 RepID=A0A2U2BB42_9BACT|nr:polysaccharide deacetylase family protein [Marinilabilia rubra]PWE00281.1 polysaccharide deacetylase [Marinilabilia rubra]